MIADFGLRIEETPIMNRKPATKTLMSINPQSEIRIPQSS